jgi:hypothetical protein
VDLWCVFGWSRELGGFREFWVNDVCREDGASVWSKDVGYGLNGLLSVEWLMGKGRGWYWVV